MDTPTALLDTPLERLLGAQTAAALAAALELSTAGDLLRHYPRRYATRGELTDLASLAVGDHVTVVADVLKTNTRRMKSRRGNLFEVVVGDGRHSLNCTFFNQPWREKDLRIGVRALFAGKVTVFNNKLQLAHPEYQLLPPGSESESEDGAADGVGVLGAVGGLVDTATVAEVAQDFTSELIPVYPAAQKVQSWVVAKCVRIVLDSLDGPSAPPDPLPSTVRAAYRLTGLVTALRGIHQPADYAEVETARKRLKWDEALVVQLALARRRLALADRPAPACPPVPDGLLDAFDEQLPFTLTDGQRTIGAVIASDLSGEHPMNRLVQGEVGSGKTLIALRAMLQVVDAGRQAALLAPTEVLAAQHARSLRELLGPLGRAGQLGGADRGTAVTLLTGSLGARGRKQALLDAASGAAGIIVGTHALIQDTVGFADLGMVVVDEQHRFGVEQRDALRTRGGSAQSPHVLVMTATPIPRTVAMTVYGDLEVSSLRELPRGRSPISTTVVPAGEKPSWLTRAWGRITEEVAAGHQAYVVCPRIGDAAAAGEDVDEPPPDPSAASERRPPMAVSDVAPALIDGPLAGLRVGVLHGRLPADEKDTVMRAFADGTIDVLVATTVVEVGVDVPNATVMVIMDADRFGVSQLHQLRGRVGRGSAPGLCLLVTEMPGGSPARERLDAVASTTDGFELARLDLEMRREGDILGAAQSGRRSGLKLLSLLRDEKIIAEARAQAALLVAENPTLDSHPALAALVHDLVTEHQAQYLEKS